MTIEMTFPLDRFSSCCVLFSMALVLPSPRIKKVMDNLLKEKRQQGLMPPAPAYGAMNSGLRLLIAVGAGAAIYWKMTASS